MPPSDASSSPRHTIDEARARLKQHFGYPDFRPPQIPAVEAVIAGRDSLIVLPTGGGKSLCYQVPALLRDGLTLVISPLISLMKDQVDALERRGLSAAFINSTLGAPAVAERMARASQGSLKLLYLAPERLESRHMVEQLRRIGVALLAVDEAHCISEWGHDFRPSYRRIGVLRRKLENPQTVALTATATPQVRADIMQQLELQNPQVVVGGFDRTNLAYHVVSARTQRDKDRAAVAWLRSASGPAIVYAPTRKAVERVAAVLVHSRVNAVAYHAGLDEQLRQRAQDAFMRERVRVIVATSAFGMGIDKPDVRLVVHHAMPGTLESYYQEAGRAGRDGNSSTCMLLHSYPDRFTHEYFIRNTHPERDVVEQVWQELRRMADAHDLVSLSHDEIAVRLPRHIGERRVGAALRTLAAANALDVEVPAPGLVFVRLLAAPPRIVAELVGERAGDRTLLRALWQALGRRFEEGAVIDLNILPRSLGGVQAVVPALHRLVTGQFLFWRPVGGGVRLNARHRNPSWLPVNWYSLERRRRADLARLDAMQGYAHCRTCRRAFVLRYFGDAAARPKCDACDRCLGCTDVGLLPDRTLNRSSA